LVHSVQTLSNNNYLLFSTTNPHWARVVGYGLFSLCVIHKKGLCPSSGDIHRLMMMMTCNFFVSRYGYELELNDKKEFIIIFAS
jgi:hypothetical protein